MKKLLVILCFLILTFCGFSGKNIFAQEGDVSVRIPESSINESIQVLLDTKAFNFAAYNGLGWLTYRTLHVHANSISTNLKAAPYGQENIELSFSVTARAAINIAFAISFNVQITGTFKIYGTTEINTEENGYKINMRPLGLRDFSATNTIIDVFLQDKFNDIISRFGTLSFTPLIQVLPSAGSQYFTSTNPTVSVTNDEVVLSLFVNELYLANDTVTNTRSYEYPYIEAGQDYKVHHNGNLTLSSGTKGIKLSNGFKADAGSDFKASINPNLDFQIHQNSNNPNGTNISGRLYNILDTLNSEVKKDAFSDIPTKFEMYQNYPNPFNPNTLIKFDIPKTAKVKVTVYDIIGKEVARIVDAELNAGVYQYNFNGSNLSSGIYFYRIEAAEFTSIKKMILIK